MKLLRDRLMLVALVAIILPNVAHADSYTELPTFEHYYHTRFGRFKVVGFKSSTLIYRKEDGWPRYISIPLPIHLLPVVPVAGFLVAVGGWLLYRRRQKHDTNAA